MPIELGFEGRNAVEHLKGKVVLPTGSAGVGVGSSLARLASQAGALVVGCDLQAGCGFEDVFVQADVTIESEAERFVETAIAKFGRVDILINNCCCARRDDRDPHDTPGEVILDAVRANAMPAINCARSAIPHMIRQGGGVIVHISSLNVPAAGYGQIAYSVAKAMLSRHAAGIAATYAHHGVRAIVPVLGTVPNDGPNWQRRDRLMPGLRKAAAAFSPSHRLLTPDEAAAAILQLCADELWCLNGAVIPLDGGTLAAVVPFGGGDWRESACRISQFGMAFDQERDATFPMEEIALSEGR